MERPRKQKRYPDLVSAYPEIASQWLTAKNEALFPHNVTAMSGRKVWWICTEGHEWQATVASRSQGGGCPICSGKKVLKGYNDLASVLPELAAQWHRTKNGALTPDRVTKGSSKKVWWQCDKGHEWQAVISSRSAGRGCPQCNPSTSFAEQALYFYISRLYQAENRYRILKKEADIYLPEFQIAVEHDGPCHRQKKVQEADRKKDILFRENGIHLIRVKDTFPFSVDESQSVICYTYDETDYADLEHAIQETLRLISLYTGNDTQLHANITRDRTAICDQYKAYELERSLFVKTSDAKVYWDWSANTLNPLYLTYGSRQKVHWKCRYGHEWTCSAADFFCGTRCPVCSGRRVLAGFNDFATVNPMLAQEWHPSRNGELHPSQVTAHSGKRVWWQCAAGHEWQATVANRSNGAGCAVCSGKRLLSGYNDLATSHPELLPEWHPSKNGTLRPDAVAAASKTKVWWRCKEGHEWQAGAGSRARGSGCPYCMGKRAIPGVNDLGTVNRELSGQWHPFRNRPLSPSDVTAHSSKKVWWRCEQGHEWEAKVSDRSRGNGCPYCSGRMAIPGTTDLRTARPELAGEWHPTQNGDLKPEQFTCMSDKQVWWRCKNGHSWKSSIANRSDGHGCPYCSGRRAVQGYNDLFTVQPQLCAEWNYERNAGVNPFDLLEKSNKKVWWRCRKGHEWQAAVCSRAAGSGCPICANKQVLAGYNDLQTVRPDLAADWHPDNNGTLTARQVTAGSHKKVWWKCAEGHEWQAAIVNRAYGTACPICAHRKVVPGINDLSCLRPELAAQWSIEKNGALRPEFVSKKSSKKVWWRCEKGHEWQATVCNRFRGDGCPYCSGRLAIAGVNDLATLAPELAREWHPEKNGILTPADVKLYSNKKVWWRCEKGHEWRTTVGSRALGNGCAQCSGRRADIGVTDLATTHPELVKEWITSKNAGITPRDVTKGSMRKIWWRCPKGHEWQASIYERVRGNGCPICSGNVVAAGYNDLATTRADLALEWHPTKNGTGRTPRTVSQGSNYKAWWLCRKGHEWQAAVSDRASGHGCPFCAGKRVLSGFNDLASLRPDLAAQWHPDKNGSLRPEDVTQHSGKKVWWTCSLGHEWQSSVDARSNGTGCPVCAGKKVWKGFNDLATRKPALAAQWHPTKNAPLTASDILATSSRLVWWRCAYGHEWQAAVSRRSDKSICPYCSRRCGGRESSGIV